MINAFTNAAQKLGPLQRIEMERFAGTLLKLLCNSSFILQFRQAKKGLPFLLFRKRVGLSFISKIGRNELTRRPV
jgi:hypothetical protein